MRSIGATTNPQLTAITQSIYDVAGWRGDRPPVLVDQRVPRWSRARAVTRPGRQSIRVHPSLLDEPEPVQRGTLAHEVAHLDGLKAERWTLFMAITASLWCAAGGMIAVAVLAASTTALSLWFLAGIVAAVAALRVAVTPQRRCERAADQRSANTLASTSLCARSSICSDTLPWCSGS